MEVLRAWFGRAGVGAWRARRQVVWGTCVLVMVGVVYLQYAPAGLLDHPSAPRHRALNTLYSPHEHEMGQQPSERAQVQRVKFVTGGEGSQMGLEGPAETRVRDEVDSNNMKY